MFVEFKLMDRFGVGVQILTIKSEMAPTSTAAAR
jgi:hypothetical protein